jgi:hypothetical protein
MCPPLSDYSRLSLRGGQKATCHLSVTGVTGEAQASAKLRVTAGSTGMPGPVVVETVIFFR